jgi:hypothetical protein
MFGFDEHRRRTIAVKQSPRRWSWQTMAGDEFRERPIMCDDQGWRAIGDLAAEIVGKLNAGSDRVMGYSDQSLAGRSLFAVLSIRFGYFMAASFVAPVAPAVSYFRRGACSAHACRQIVDRFTYPVTETGKGRLAVSTSPEDGRPAQHHAALSLCIQEIAARPMNSE